MRRMIFILCLFIAIPAAPAAATSPWVHEDWQMRVHFEADSTLIEGSETFEDFALLVTLDGVRHPDVFAHAKSDGSDLLFASAYGAMVLEREVVTYDPVAEEAEIWVRVPGLSKLNNGFYLYFQNPAANLDPTPATAWSTDYRAVYHFEEDPAGLLLTDSSPAGVDITFNASHGWTSGDRVPVKIGQGWHFNGTTHHIASSQISTQDPSWTVEAWLTHDLLGNTDFFFHVQPGFWHLKSQNWNWRAPDWVPPTGGFLVWYPQPIQVGGPANHYLWKFDAVDDTVQFFYNGEPQDIRWRYNIGSPLYTEQLVNPNQDQPVGIVGPIFQSVVEDYHNGQADEFRLREGRPSAARILTEFRTANDPVAFLNFGNTESIGATGVAAATRLWLRAYPNPSPGSTSIRYSLPAEGRVRIAVYDVAGRKVASLLDQSMPSGSWTVRWDGRSTGGQPVSAGLYFLRLETPSESRSTKITVVR